MLPEGKYTLSFTDSAGALSNVINNGTYGLCGSSSAPVVLKFKEAHGVRSAFHLTFGAYYVVNSGTKGLMGTTGAPGTPLFISNLEKAGNDYKCQFLMDGNLSYSVSNDGTYGLYGTGPSAAEPMVFTLTPVA